MTYFCANAARLAEYCWQGSKKPEDSSVAESSTPQKASFLSKTMKPTAAVDAAGGLTLLTLGLIRIFAPHAVPFVGSFSQPFMIAGIAVLGGNGAIKIVKECAAQEEEEAKPAAPTAEDTAALNTEGEAAPAATAPPPEEPLRGGAPSDASSAAERAAGRTSPPVPPHVDDEAAQPAEARAAGTGTTPPAEDGGNPDGA